VHGNETCGTKGIHRVMAELDSGALSIVAGSVTFVPITNPLAYARACQRRPQPEPQPVPERQSAGFRRPHRQLAVSAAGPARRAARLAPFNADSQPFVMVGPRNNDGPLQPFQHEDKERALARRLGVRRFVDGWLHAYGQGVQRRLGNSDGGPRPALWRGHDGIHAFNGGYALTLECGPCGPGRTGRRLPRHHEHPRLPRFH
jgi:hypothetical protein